MARLRRRHPPAPPLSPEQRAEETDRRRSRAHDEPLDLRPDPRRPYLVLRVSNPLRGTHHSIHLPEYPGWESAVCDCTDFALRSVGTCKHLEAARTWVRTHGAELPKPLSGPTAASRRLWKEVDERIRGLRSDRRPPSQRWRGPGSILYDPPNVAE